jgi:sporulation protein YlmC with PRC-barrel domain
VKPVEFGLVRDVLDHAIVDASGVPCGMVDDVELDASPGKPVEIVALLVGPGAAQRRLPRWAAKLAAAAFGRAEHRIEWRRVARIGEHIVLDADAAEVGLGAADRKWSRRVARIPGS